jgi:polysaccharide export outer membrane protein
MIISTGDAMSYATRTTIRRAPSLAAALAVALTACWGPAVRAQDYLIQKGDVLDVSVLEDPGLNRQALVRPDGKISLPLAGALNAAGMTPEALQTAIRGALRRDFVEPPTVTVSLLSLAAAEAAATTPIYILGEVRAPGRYEVALPMDALQALALAGGPGVFAARDRVQVRRRVEGAETLTVFDYDQVENGAAIPEPIELAAGDVIVVPERGLFD